METARTPFGTYGTDEIMTLTGKSTGTEGREKAAAPDPLSIKVTDPSVAARDEARSDLEALRFTQLRRLCVVVNGVCLAHRHWESRTRLEPWEQQALADDRRELMRFVLPGSGENKVALAEAGANVTEADAKAIARAFPRRRVYWKGAEVVGS